MKTCRVAVLLVLTALAAPAAAQIRITGSIAGTVIDGADAVIPGATVQLKDEATGRTQDTVTNASGFFSLPDLNHGSYTLTVSLPGFQTAVYSKVAVESGRTTDLRIKLGVGGIEQSVTVEGASPVLETSSNMISATLNRKTITQIPLAGRNVFTMATLIPGAASPQGGSPHYNGMPGGTINPTIDGVNNSSNGWKSGGTSFFGTVPARLGAIEEVTVETTGQGAEAGAMGGVNLKFVTRRGSNQMRGSGFWQHRNEFFNANSFSNNARQIEKNRLRRHDFGGNFGGPLAPGTTLRDKLFFFVNYEQEYIPQTNTREETVLKPEYTLGTPTGDPAQGIFNSTSLPGIPNAELANVRNLYALLTGRISSVATGRILDPDTLLYSDSIYRENWTASNMGGVFAQDQWRLTPDFTLNYGLRYEVTGHPYSKLGNANFPDTANLYGPSTELFKPGRLNGVLNPTIVRGKSAAKTDWNNVAPNIGFAWTPMADGTAFSPGSSAAAARPSSAAAIR